MKSKPTTQPPPSPITKVVVVSDLHVWSTVGLWPEGYESTKGSLIAQNDFQKLTWECWMKMWMDIIPGLMGSDPYLLIVNGDVVEGQHHRTVEIMTANPDDQMPALLKVFEPCRHSAIVLVEGTECHTHSMEHKAAIELGGIPCPNTRQPAHPKLFMDIGGFRLIARHHMPTTSIPWGEARALKAEFDKETIAASEAGETAPQVVCLAHRHVAGVHRYKTQGIAICTPAWQGLTRHSYKVVPHAHACTPGAVVLDFDNIRQDGLPDAEAILFKPKPAKSVRI
jgi:hypothetical protein